MRKNVSQLKVGIILSYLSRIVQLGVGLFYTPIMIRILGQSEYGLYNIAASTIAYLGVLNFGFGSAYMRYYSRYKAKVDKGKIALLNGMFLIIFSILGIIAVVAGIVLALNIDIVFGPSLSINELVTTRLLILILVINLAISFPAIVFNTYLQANEKFIFQNSIQIIRQITTPLLNLPLLFAGYGSVGMVSGSVIVNVFIDIVIVLYCVKKMKMKFSFNKFDHDLMKEITVYSSFIFINMIVDQVNNNMDKTILGRYQGTISVAVYSVASTLRLYYQQLATTISSVFTPRVHRLVAMDTLNSELTGLFTRVGRIQFSLLNLVLLGFVFFGRPFIGIWAGADYYDAYVIALILMFPISIPLIQTIGIEIQRAKNMHHFRSWIYLIMAVGNLVITIPLSQQFGAKGAAIGTALSLFFGNGLAMNWYNHTKIGLDVFYFWKEISKFIPAIILPFIYGVLVNYFGDLYNVKQLLVFGCLFIIIYILSMWYLGFNDYEKKLLKNPFK